MKIVIALADHLVAFIVFYVAYTETRSATLFWALVFLHGKQTLLAFNVGQIANIFERMFEHKSRREASSD